ncbi:NADPH-dependent F420 reductase [Allobranchiibius sp. GilTou73]|uniref:NADPH-dependent F420 reductase n=1 Tax=Allobranchiibius sp. GilTou73 TaxID=2904523 RepID=UPI001F4800F5|nr:NAD(P)-binding domain-containing protein [Allobranchiibius sp. GilTou73]UIJ35728.1 NAD(P)-binding domain-containing protein [Allobranchiibius sp. GilTou73]
MTTIGFIGSGNIGGTVAQLAVDAGYDVVVSNSRGPETLADLVQSLGPKARAATSSEAAAAGDIVVVTIPLGKIEQVPAQALAGKVVIDTCNYYPERDGAIAALDEKQTTTSGLVQQHLASAKVVKAFNNIFFGHLGSMQRPRGAADRNTLMIAGDDAAAKRTVSDFIDAIGYDVFDTGSLADSWRFQRDQPAYAGAYAEGGDFNKPKRADRAELQGLLDQADATIR